MFTYLARSKVGERLSRATCEDRTRANDTLRQTWDDLYVGICSEVLSVVVSSTLDCNKSGWCIASCLIKRVSFGVVPPG